MARTARVKRTGKDKLHYTVRLDYADGTSFTAEGRGGINTFDCSTPNPNFAEESDTITSFKSFPTTNRVFTVANVYSTTVVNPNPKKVIDTITFSRGEKRCARIGVYRSLGTIYETEKNWYDAWVTYQRSLAADYNQPDVWESEKQMKAKLGIK